jgi:hypothetical protein
MDGVIRRFIAAGLLLEFVLRRGRRATTESHSESDAQASPLVRGPC